MSRLDSPVARIATPAAAMLSATPIRLQVQSMPSASSPSGSPETAVHTFCHSIPDTWYQMGVILAATDCLNWLAAQRKGTRAVWKIKNVSAFKATDADAASGK